MFDEDPRDGGDPLEELEYHDLLKLTRRLIKERDALKARAALAQPSAVEELVSGLRQFVECSPCQNGCAPSDMTCATRRAEFLIAKYGAAP